MAQTLCEKFAVVCMSYPFEGICNKFMFHLGKIHVLMRQLLEDISDQYDTRCKQNLNRVRNRLMHQTRYLSCGTGSSKGC